MQNLINSKMIAKIVMIVALLFSFNSGIFAQQSSKDSVALIKEDFKLYEEVTVKPFFPGGIQEFYKFIAKRIKLSERALEANTNSSGKITAKFFIEKDGSLSNIEIIRNDLGFGSGKETIRVLKLSPKWIPGSDNGEPVRVLYDSFPITVKMHTTVTRYDSNNNPSPMPARKTGLGY